MVSVVIIKNLTYVSRKILSTSFSARVLQSFLIVLMPRYKNEIVINKGIRILNN